MGWSSCPESRLVYVNSANVMDSLQYTVDQNLASVVSMSYLTIKGLKPGTYYLFQVRALVGTEYTDWSDSVPKICK
jgi:hypothetical protein